MTDEIIIDGVDVNECAYFKMNNRMPMCRACNSGVGSPYCEYHKDCYYKQLKRKEQEYEMLKIEVEDIAEARMEICNQCGGRDDYNIPCKQIRDLDYGLQLEIEENNKLKQALDEIEELAKHNNFLVRDPFCGPGYRDLSGQMLNIINKAKEQ